MARPAAEAWPYPASAPVPPPCPPPDLGGHPSTQNRAPSPRLPRGQAPAPKDSGSVRGEPGPGLPAGTGSPHRTAPPPVAGRPSLASRFLPLHSAGRPSCRRGRPWGRRGGASPPPPLLSLRLAAPDGQRRRSVLPRSLVSAGPGGARPPFPSLPPGGDGSGALKPLPPPRRPLSPAAPGPTGRGGRWVVEGRPSGGELRRVRARAEGGDRRQGRPSQAGPAAGWGILPLPGSGGGGGRPRLPEWGLEVGVGAARCCGGEGGSRKAAQRAPSWHHLRAAAGCATPPPRCRGAGSGAAGQAPAGRNLVSPRPGFEPAHTRYRSQLLQSWERRIDLARGEEREWKRSCAALSSSRQSFFINFPTGTTPALSVGIAVVSK